MANIRCDCCGAVAVAIAVSPLGVAVGDARAAVPVCEADAEAARQCGDAVAPLAQAVAA